MTNDKCTKIMMDGEFTEDYSYKGFTIQINPSVTKGYSGRYNVRNYKRLDSGRFVSMGVETLANAKAFIDSIK